MDYPVHFRELQRTPLELVHPVATVFAERPRPPFVQFRADGSEHLAIPDIEPYGVRTQEAITPFGPDAVSISDDLLRIENLDAHDGSSRIPRRDYSVLQVPESIRNMVAISMGTRGRLNDLGELYFRTGRMLARTGENYTMPTVGLPDLALVRDTGRVVFIPLVKFGNGKTDNVQLKVDLAESIKEKLIEKHSPRVIGALIEAMTEGIDDGNSRSN
jgi:hypothetical protein